MISASNIRLSFGRREILKGVSARVEPGTFTAIIGPNGAGKSTLLKVMTGELAASSGSVEFEGRDILKLPPHELAARRAVLSQSSRLSFPFTVLEVVRLGLDARPGLGAAVREAAPQAALESVDLAGFGGRMYQELSGGEQQRVQLARVLCQAGAPFSDGQPQYLFLDEPTSSLDIRHQIDTLKLARGFARKGGGVMAVLHDLGLAAAFADRLIVIHDGQIASEGAPANVLTDKLVTEVFRVTLRSAALPKDQRFTLPYQV